VDGFESVRYLWVSIKAFGFRWSSPGSSSSGISGCQLSMLGHVSPD